MELQSQRDSVQKDLEEIKQGTQKFMTEINKKINEGKTKHQELSKEVSLECVCVANSYFTAICHFYIGDLRISYSKGR